MRNAYIFVGLDEQKVLTDARRDSKPGFAKERPEEVTVHWHKHGEDCDGHKHMTFFDGELQSESEGES